VEAQSDTLLNPSAEAPPRAPRGERNDSRRGGRGERGERGDNVERGERAELEVGAAPAADAGGARTFVDTIPSQTAPADGEREGPRRRRRGGRGGRDRDETRADAQLPGTDSVAGDAAAARMESRPQDGENTSPRPEDDGQAEREGGRRRGRGRDRNRYEAGDARQGERGADAPLPDASDRAPDLAPERVDAAPSSAHAEHEPAVQVAQPTPAAFLAEPAYVPTPRAVAVPATAPDEAPAPAVVATRFALPIDDLRALARSAGLEWVNSDADRILVVQQAMANEPKRVHVPRAPRPRVVIDDGPLVLVETRKDLSQMKLPFERQNAPAA
jgi:ribonuclease E